MESPCKWYPLPVFPELPPLLISACFGEKSYTLHVTDLANIWTEKLGRRDILRRCLDEDPSIDPTDNPDQWPVFLGKLKDVVDPTSPDHHLTSISIAAGDRSTNQDNLALLLVCELPSPLRTLRWPVQLVKCQPASLTSELVLPLIREHHVKRLEAEDLIRRLKDKDALIKKLLNKLKSMKTPLEHIFNSLSGKHGITTAAAEERVNGLAPFNPEKWRSEQSVESPQDASSLLRNVFIDSGFSCMAGLDLGVSETLNDWWAELGPDFQVSLRPENSTSRQELREQASASDISSEHVDDQAFEVQATPTPQSSPTAKSTAMHEASKTNESDFSDNHPTQSRNKVRPKIGTIGNSKMPPMDQSTNQSSRALRADEDDTASDPEDDDSPAPPKHTGKPATRLGTIGGPKRTPQAIEAMTSNEPSAEANDETESDPDSDSDSPQSPKASSSKAPMTPRKGALGRIGGKSRDTAGPQSPKTSTPVTDDNSAPPKKTEVRKIGAIGGKPHTESKRARPDTPEEEEVETDEQRAERKRAELAKELEQKSKAPTRKKRRF